MSVKRVVLITIVITIVMVFSLVVTASSASAQPTSVALPPYEEKINLPRHYLFREEASEDALGLTDDETLTGLYLEASLLSAQQAISVTFPGGPWPWYAQEEITVRPEPPIAGHPTELCAEVINLDLTNPHTVTLEFSVASFGIGVPFTPVDQTPVVVPPGGTARGCVIWVPPQPERWCIQVAIKNGQDPPEISQRNIDVWEPLVPGLEHVLPFPVGPFPDRTVISFTAQNILPGWGVQIDPISLTLGANLPGTATLRVTPPRDVPLGSREVVAEVEGYVAGNLIGGFRKFDGPPVLLHRPGEPFFAESEISVTPYPPRTGEPTHICAELRNLSGITRTVEVQFSWANFGISLPFQPINGPVIAEVPPHGKTTVCTAWVPPFGGHFCFQARLHILGNIPYHDQFSQRNIDVGEPLEPGIPHVTHFQVGNSFNEFTNPNPVTTEIWLETDIHQPDWEVTLSPNVLPAMGPGETRPVTMTVTPPDRALPDDGTPVVDVRAYFDTVEGPHVMGGFRKVFRPPVPIHQPGEPPYGESEISIAPYPPRAGEPTKICTRVRNHTNLTRTVQVKFGVANFGIGLPFVPIAAPIMVELPPHSEKEVCVNHVFSYGGHFCVQVHIQDPGGDYPEVISQRNLDVAEILKPGQPDQFEVPIGNPFDHPVTITLGLINHMPNWEISLSDWVLPNVPPQPAPPVTVTVRLTPTEDVMGLEDGTLVLDLEAYADNELIGGIRKVFRPPVILHPFPDPPYAEREISVHPYPPLAGEPTEVCVELRNPTPWPQDVVVQFSWAHFGIGIPFTPINGPRPVHLPPFSIVNECIHWIPPVSGHMCLQVELFIDGYEPQRSQRNIDVDEPLRPGEPHSRRFPVGNPSNRPVTITLGVIPHQPDWELGLSQDILPDMQPGEVREITLTVRPPAGRPLPPDGQPIVDVEAFIEGELIGGFRKAFRPPVILHPFPDPPYAEREISVHPYPPLAGEPTEVCVELRNPTPWPQDVVVQFSWAHFGIGIPFTPINGPRPVHLPPFSIVNECIHWVPPVSGHVCLQVELFMDGHEPQRSQRNIDVNEPLEPGISHSRRFPVGNPFEHPVTITLGLIPHLPDWGLELSQDVLPNMGPGEVRPITLTVTPPPDRPLPPDGHAIVDVEALVEGHLIGGFRKVFRPPIPLHPFPDPFYAEREISVHPYPPLTGEPTQVCVELRNPTPWPQDVVVQFSWAHFGIGIPFQPINGPRPVHLPPFSIVNECIHWIPPVSGHVCLQVELFMDGHEPQRSQRNIDVDEPLRPGEPHSRRFPVGNPSNHPLTITLGVIPHQPDWELGLSQDVLPDMQPGEVREITLTVRPPADQPLPPDGHLLVDVEAFAEGNLIGGFRKVFRPPVILHPFPDPPYAEREITVHPYPPRAGEPAQVCVELRNPTPWPQNVVVQFSWAHFGIGIPFTPINGPRPVHLPPFSVVNECIHWIPPVSGNVCLQVELFMDGHEPQRSRLNIDVDEPLKPGVPHSRRFPVGNPSNRPVTITLGLIPHLPDWGLELSQDVLPNMEPGEVRGITLTVIPPRDRLLPPDGHPIVDVEAFVEGHLIGGFRKIFRPEVPIHRPKDPIYAESEIFVHPYPPRAHEPTELSVEIRNPTNEPQTVEVVFSVAPFGIGLPFKPVNEPILVGIPPHGMVRPGTIWLPPHGGLWCIQVDIFVPGHDKSFYSQRNIDVGEPLEPNVPHSRPFPVGNPFTYPVTISLGLIPHFPDWGLELQPDVLRNIGPGEVREVVLTVTPPADLPADGDPIVDVEAFVEGRLIGGFRKIFHPPVPVHRPKDPIYAESEIFVDPYPVIPGVPTLLGVEVFNPTNKDRIVTATFSIARFGIGLPFSTAHIGPDNPIRIFVPAHGAARGHVFWEPPRWRGKFCVRVTLEMEGHEPIWSQRNIDVGEPLRRGQPHSLVFPVGAWPYTETVTVSLGLINHRDRWLTEISTDTVIVDPGQVVSVTLTVVPPNDARLGTGRPIVDVEAFVEGDIIGGFRKLDIPPIPIHKPHEKEYAETELSIDPDPPRLGQDARVSAVVQNNGPSTSSVILEFGWAKFGMGIPFTTTGMVPYTRSVTLAPAMTATAWVTWTPIYSGPQCVMVKLIDPAEDYEDLISMRNVHVVERPPCGVTRTFTLTVYNDSPFTVTVDVGLITFDVPAGWIVSTIPSDTLELGPFSEGVIQVIVEIPCPLTLQAMHAAQKMYVLQEEAGGVPTIDVESYVNGELVGGIELQFPARPEEPAIQPSDVTISGPTTGTVNTAYTFTATVSPPTATTPIVYTWSPVPVSGQGTASVIYNWASAGVKTITVTASNAGGEATDTHTITISAPPGVTRVEEVTISGPTTGTVGIAYTFTATVSPPTATTPINYTWQATGQLLETHPDGGPSDSHTFTWGKPGTKAITVTASNAGGESTGFYSIVIERGVYYRIYLPVVLKKQ